MATAKYRVWFGFYTPAGVRYPRGSVATLTDGEAGLERISGKIELLTHATAPTVNDDDAAGYAVGERWIDTTGPTEYVCLDATTGAAVWSQTATGA